MKAQTYYQLFDQEKAEFALDNAILHNPNSVAALLIRAQFKELIGLKKLTNAKMIKVPIVVRRQVLRPKIACTILPPSS